MDVRFWQMSDRGTSKQACNGIGDGSTGVGRRRGQEVRFRGLPKHSAECSGAGCGAETGIVPTRNALNLIVINFHGGFFISNIILRPFFKMWIVVEKAQLKSWSADSGPRNTYPWPNQKRFSRIRVNSHSRETTRRSGQTPSWLPLLASAGLRNLHPRYATIKIKILTGNFRH